MATRLKIMVTANNTRYWSVASIVVKDILVSKGIVG
jgi:hypothetical protein